MIHRKPRRRLASVCAGLLFLAASPAPLPAAPADLGQGLRYLRIENSDTNFAALQAALAESAPLVIDLRAARPPSGSGGSRPPSAALRAGVRQSPAAAAPLRLLLVNSDTPPALLRAFALPAPGWLVLGPAVPGLAVDITVAASPDADRRAAAALAAGAPPASLLNRQPAKTRYDEAALLRDYTDQPPPEISGTDGGGSDAQAGSEPLPPADAVLQRAQDIHRALLALKRIP